MAAGRSRTIAARGNWCKDTVEREANVAAEN